MLSIYFSVQNAKGSEWENWMNGSYGSNRYEYEWEKKDTVYSKMADEKYVEWGKNRSKNTQIPLMF